MTIKTSVKIPEVSSTAQVTTAGIADKSVTKAKLASDINIPSITISTSEPTASDGSNGDIWIVYKES